MKEDQEQKLQIQNNSAVSIKQKIQGICQKNQPTSNPKQNDANIKLASLSNWGRKNAKKIYRILFIAFAFVLIILFSITFFANSGKKLQTQGAVENKENLYRYNNREKLPDVGSLNQSDQNSIDDENAKDHFGGVPESQLFSKQKQNNGQQNNQKLQEINQKKNKQIVLMNRPQLLQISNSYSQTNQNTQNSHDFISKDQKQKPQSEQKQIPNEYSQANLYIQNPSNFIYKDQKELRRQEQKQIFYQKRRIQRQRRKEAKKKRQGPVYNILSVVNKNPYLDEQYANISKSDIERAKRWRYLLTMEFSQTSSISQGEHQYYQKKYNIDKYDELPFCLVIPTFNNIQKKRYLKNIISVVMQNYTNYHFVVIDDGSTDGTGQKIEQFLKYEQTKIPPERYSVIIYKERHFAMPNLRQAAKYFCKPEEIFMIVDGDDQLLGRYVLKLFNSVFQEKKVWFMYTNFLSSFGKLGYSRPYHPDIIQDNDYRNYTFAVSHLRAYYTKLFLNIKQEDLQDQNGAYFTSANDMAICIPSLEQSHTRIAYIPELTYYYNINTGQNVHKSRLQEQRQNNLKIRAKQSYNPLEKLFPEHQI